MSDATPASATMRQRLSDWSRQPSTQQGLSLLVGGCVLAWTHPFGDAEGIAATIVAASLPRLWPDNTTDAIRLGAVSNAIVHAMATRKATDLATLAETASSLLKPAGSGA